MYSLSDFIWDFGKLPFPSHLGKYVITIGKLSTKIHEGLDGGSGIHYSLKI